ncbi:ectomycorrhiza-upregulated zf-MYND domain-containing protein [Salix suchowensis]|nr:ectomycorrhiza-upregulated zf-MYND domain-containing protein [Salix suchowensis]
MQAYAVILSTMPPTTSHIEYCDKCHLPIKTPKVCNECGTASYCVCILATALMSAHYIEPTLRSQSSAKKNTTKSTNPLVVHYLPKKSVLPGPPGHPPQFRHELLTINHRIFLKDGNKQNICLGSLLCGVPLLWYRSEQVQRKRTLKRHGVLGIHPETNPTAAANSMSTPEESYSPSSSNIKPHMTGAMSRRSGLGLRCITSSPISENPPTGESTQQTSDSSPKYNQAATLLCVDPNTGVAPDHFDGPDEKLLTRELIETIWKFHCSIKEDSEKAEYNWATMSDLMTREAFQSFQSEYYLEQTAKGRAGFDPL